MAPTEAGYAFKGWYKDAALTQKWDFAVDTVGNVDFTLYAKWEERKGVLYKQDYEDVEKVDTTIATSPNAAGNLKIATRIMANICCLISRETLRQTAAVRM